MQFNTEGVKRVEKKVNFELVGLDGTAFFLLGTFRRAAKKQGWLNEDVNAVVAEAQSGDYDHLLQTLMHFAGDSVDCSEKALQRC